MLECLKLNDRWLLNVFILNTSLTTALSKSIVGDGVGCIGPRLDRWNMTGLRKCTYGQLCYKVMLHSCWFYSSEVTFRPTTQNHFFFKYLRTILCDLTVSYVFNTECFVVSALLLLQYCGCSIRSFFPFSHRNLCSLLFFENKRDRIETLTHCAKWSSRTISFFR